MHIPTYNTHVNFVCILRIFEDRVAEALDCGDEVANWLSKFLEKDGLRLLYHFIDKTQRDLTPLQKKFPNFDPSHKVIC